MFFLCFQAQFLFNLFLAVFFVDLIAASNVCLVIIVERVHCVWVRIQNLDVVDVVVAEGFLDLIQEFEAFLQFLVQLNVMNGLFHLCYLDIELLFLHLHQLIKCVPALRQRHLKVHFRQLQLLLIGIHSSGEIFVKSNDVGADFTHLVN